MPVPDFTPYKVVGGEVSSATKFGNFVQAVQNEFGDINQDQITGLTYTPYTLGWTSTGTAPALGNSVVISRYAQIGKLVAVTFKLTFGNTATFGTGTYRFSLPVAAADTAHRPVGFFEMFDSSTGNYGTAVAWLPTATTIEIVFGATYLGVNTAVAATTPWAWATSDFISANIIYEAA